MPKHRKCHKKIRIASTSSQRAWTIRSDWVQGLGLLSGLPDVCPNWNASVYSNAAALSVEGCSRSRLWLPAALERRLWASWALTRGAPPQAGNGAGKTLRRG